MKVIELKSANAVFKGDGYIDVPATTYQYEDGTPGIEICLELSPEEIAEITKNHRLYLYKIGTILQPFYLSTVREITTEEATDNET